MYSKENAFKYCCEDVSQIEGYDKVLANPNECWVIHHLLEDHYEDGTPRKAGEWLSRVELIEQGKYFRRPAKEFSFITVKEHDKLHGGNKKFGDKKCDSAFMFCCEDPSKIANYDKVITNTKEKWVIHHLLEGCYEDGTPREHGKWLKRNELIEQGKYFRRPASELIYLTAKEHAKLHAVESFQTKGKPMSEETKKRLAEINKGRHHSKETIEKIIQSNRGKKRSEEFCKRMSGSNNPFYGRKHTAEILMKVSMAGKGRRWYNNGVQETCCHECPEGFQPGRLKSVGAKVSEAIRRGKENV